jgi:hypothetical protein
MKRIVKKTTKKTKKSIVNNDLPFLIVRLGDKEKGWIPSKEHADAFAEMAQSLGLDKRFNIIIYHYAIEFEILDNKNNLKDCGLQIVDINAFNKFIDDTSKEKKILQDYYKDEVLTIIERDDKITKKGDKTVYESLPYKPTKTPLRKVKKTVG